MLKLLWVEPRPPTSTTTTKNPHGHISEDTPEGESWDNENGQTGRHQSQRGVIMISVFQTGTFGEARSAREVSACKLNTGLVPRWGGAAQTPGTWFLLYIQRNEIYTVTAVTPLVGVYLTVLMGLEEAHQPHCQSRGRSRLWGGAGVDRSSPTLPVGYS